MSDNRKVAAALLVEAGETVMNKRPGHGDAENSFQMIADLWMIYLRHCRRVRGTDAIRPEDVAEMMTLLKKARKIYGSSNRDNYVDDIGYEALAGMLALPDPTEDPMDKVDVTEEDKTEKTEDPPIVMKHTNISNDENLTKLKGAIKRSGGAGR